VRACARVFEPAGRDTYRCAHWLSSECVCASAGERTFWPEGQLIRKKVPAAAVVGVTRRRSRIAPCTYIIILYILLLWYLPFSEMLLLLLYLLFVIVIMLLDIRASPPSPADSYAFAYFFFPVHLRCAEWARSSFDSRNLKRIQNRNRSIMNFKFAVFYFSEVLCCSQGW